MGRPPSFLVRGKKDRGNVTQETTAGDRSMEERSFHAMLHHLRMPFRGFDTMHLANGKKIVVVNSDSDGMTHSADRFTPDQSSYHMTVLSRKGVHNTPMLYPEALIEDVEKMDRGEAQ